METRVRRFLGKMREVFSRRPLGSGKGIMDKVAAVRQMLLHKRIASVLSIHDYFQVHFRDGAIMNLYSRHSLEEGDAQDVLGQKVVSVSIRKDDHRLEIELENGKQIFVGLLDEDYRGPEVLSIHSDGKLLVWN
jgi:hypothetical protein